MFATFVATNSWQKADWLAATGPSTTQLSLLTLSVTKYSETKSTWQSTLAKYACGSCGCQTNRKFSFGRHGQESVIHQSVLLLVLRVRNVCEQMEYGVTHKERPWTRWERKRYWEQCRDCEREIEWNESKEASSPMWRVLVQYYSKSKS